jgi:hypothetical protein
MNIKSPTQNWLTVFLALALLAGAPATGPAIGPDMSIAKDQYHFPAPAVDEWKAVKPDPDAESITFLNSKEDGAIQLVLLPKDASVDPDIAMNVAVAMLKQIKADRAKQGVEMVMQPKIEKDKRFAIVIHEKYKVKNDQVADQLHVYKSVGPRVLMLTVNSVAIDADRTAAIHAAGEDLLDAVKFNRKAFKKGS